MFIKNILDRSKYAAMRAHHLKLMGVSIDKNGHYDLLPLTNTNIAVIELHITGGCRVGVFQQSILSSRHTVGHKGHRRLSNHLID